MKLDEKRLDAAWAEARRCDPVFETIREAEAAYERLRA